MFTDKRDIFIKNRINSMDFLRGLALIFMIQVHIYYHWIYWTNIDYGSYETIIFFFGGLAAPFFLLVSGISFYLFINQKQIKNLQKRTIFFDVFKRALFIFIISTIFQIFLGSIFNIQITFIIYWSIFQVIAFSMIIFFYLPFLKRNLRVFLYISLFIFIILLNYTINFYDFEFLDILIDGTFALIPWAIYFLFGLSLGDLLKNSSQIQFIKYLYILLPIGVTFLIVGILDVSITGVIDNKKIEFYMACFGAFLILFLACHYYIDIKTINLSFTRIIARWGTLAFSIYYIQYGILAIGIIIFPFLINNLYSSGFLLYQYVIILLIFLLIVESILRLWQKFNYIFGLEWFMNKLSHKSLFSNNK